MTVRIIGAGVVGLTTAVEFAARGVPVAVYERAAGLGPHHCSWYAGGMLAPWCERESAEPLILTLGVESMQWWRRYVPVIDTGTLVVAQRRDIPDLKRFAARTERHEWLDAQRIAELEPDLAGRFQQALFFAAEAMLEPRQALQHLLSTLAQLGGAVHFNHSASAAALHGSDTRAVIDCTGLAARQALQPLRGVKGEMLLLRTHDVQLSRPVRMLHPRIPMYIVPRAQGVFMVGATMIESDDEQHVSARAVLELLNAVYALHPAFADAEVLETGTQVRPAFTDNLPRIVQQDRVWYVNGCYRHGYLTAPALARRVADAVLNGAHFAEVMDADPAQRQSA